SSIEDWGGRLWTFTYDGLRNLTSFTEPEGCSTQFTYQTVGTVSLVHTIEDSRGYRTTYTFDGQNRVTKLVAGQPVTTWTYSSGQKVKKDSCGALTTCACSPSGPLQNVKYPVGNQVTYTYDTLGLIAKEQTNLGYSYSVAYDGSNRITASDDILGNRTT